MARWRAATTAFAFALVLARAGYAEPDSPDATALQAYSEEITVAADGSFTTTSHSELIARNEAGAMQASRMSVFYDSEMQTAEILEAHTLKKDGTKIPVDVRTIYEQLPADNTLAVSSFRVKVLLFPQFAAGDTAVYTVRITNPKPMFPGAFYSGRSFPRSYTFKDAKITITTPKSLPLRVENHDVKFAKDDHGDTIVYRWQYSGTADPSVKTPMVSPNDREPRFFASSFKDYGELGRAYAEQAEPKAAVTDKIRTLADDITKKANGQREQARLIYEWVVQHIRFVAIELGRGSFVPHDADTVLARGYGDCKDHDTLLRALLKAKDIEAQAILINSNNTYTLSEAPGFNQLDHVITYLPDINVYVDASVPVAAFGVLPQAEYGKPAVRATRKGAGLVTLPMPKPGSATINQTTVQKIAPDGTLSGTTTTTATGPFAITLRYIGYAVQSVGPEKAGELQMASRGFKDAKGRLIPDSLTELGDSFTIRGEFSAKGWGDVLKGESTIMPGGLRLLPVTGDGIMGPLYATDEIASEPTVCIGANTSEDLSLEVPTGYAVRFLPKDVKVTTPNLTFTAHWTEKDNILAVHRTFTSTTDKPICSGQMRKQTAEALEQISKNFDQSVQIIRTAQSFRTAPQPPANDVAERISRGQAYEKEGDHANAVAEFTAALAIDPNDSKARFDRAYSYDVMDDREHAIADYTSLIALNDNNAPARANRGRIYAAQNKFDLALADYDRAVALEPDAPDYLMMRGYLNMATRKYDRAAADFGGVIAKQPGKSDAYIARCDALHQNNEDQAALSDCNKAVQLEKNSSRLYLLRSEIRHKLGDHFGGNRDSAKAAEIDPKLEQAGGLWRAVRMQNGKEVAGKNISPMEASMIEGGRLFDLEDYDGAIVAFERAIKQGLPDTSVLLQLCVALSHTDRLADAAYQCSRALQIKDNNASTLRARGRVYFRQGKYREALEDFATIQRLDPGDSLSLYERGVTKLKLGDKSGQADIDKATERNPTIARRVPKAMRP